MSKDAKPKYRIVRPDKASAEAPDELAEDRLFLLRELTCAAGELPLDAVAALTDAARDLRGRQCRPALIAQIGALCRGFTTDELESLVEQLRELVCPPLATPARLSVAVQLSPEKLRGDGGRRKTRRRRPSSDRS